MSVQHLLQPLLAWLVAHGGMLAAGATVILAGGCLGMLLYRDPQSRRRIGGWTASGLAAYLLLACVPLPRWHLPSWSSAPVAAESSVVAPQPYQGPPPAPMTAPPAADRAVILFDIEQPLPSGAEPGIPVAAPVPSMPWPEMLAWIWLLGASLTGCWLLMGRLALASVLRRTRPGPSALSAVLPARARLRLLDGAITPFCCGLWRPAVVLPSALAEPSRQSQAVAVLRHEGAHLRAGDLRLQTLLAALLPLFWWHPLFWILRARVRLCAEMLADAAAAEASSVHGYVRDLLDLAEASDPMVAAAPALSVFRRHSELTRRIEMLLHTTAPWSSSLVRRSAQAAATAALAAASVGFFGVAPAAAQQDPARPDLRAQNQELQDEIARLRASIAALRERLAQDPRAATTGSSASHATTAESGGGLLGSIIADPQAAAELQRIMKAQTSTSTAGTVSTSDPQPTEGRALGDLERLLNSASLVTMRKEPLDSFRPRPTAGQDTGRGGDSMSMLELASRAIQLRGEVEIASADADRITQLVAAGAVDTREARAAQVKLQVAKQTLVVAQRLVEAEIEAATDEVKELKAAIGKAQGEEAQPLERRLRLLSRRLEALAQAR